MNSPVLYVTVHRDITDCFVGQLSDYIFQMNVSENSMDCSLKEKNADVNYKTIVHKKDNGEYFTYRYNY